MMMMMMMMMMNTEPKFSATVQFILLDNTISDRCRCYQKKCRRFA